jgi:hypothetical protein
MPRVTGTRKQLAEELLKTATNGPSHSLCFSRARLTEEQQQILEKELREGYELWSSSWLLPKIKRLVPELKE